MTMGFLTLTMLSSAPPVDTQGFANALSMLLVVQQKCIRAFWRERSHVTIAIQSSMSPLSFLL